MVGAVALVALCGPRETASTLAAAWEALAIGRRESGLVIQLLSLILVAILATPVVVYTHRAAKKLPAKPAKAPVSPVSSRSAAARAPARSTAATTSAAAASPVL